MVYQQLQYSWPSSSDSDGTSDANGDASNTSSDNSDRLAGMYIIISRLDFLHNPVRRN